MRTPRITVLNTNNDTERMVDEFIKICREDGFVQELQERRRFIDPYQKRKMKKKKAIQNNAKDLDRIRRKYKHKLPENRH